MESRKMLEINLFTGREWRHRYQEQVCGYRGEGEGGTNWESSIDIYTLSSVKQWVGSCYITQGACPGTLWWLRGVGLGEGREDQQGGYLYIIMTDLCCCIAESNTTL